MASFRRRPILILSLLIIVAVATISGTLALRDRHPMRTLEHPEYLSLNGGDVFSIPKSMVVDEQAIAGLQLVYSGSVANNSYDTVLENGGISVQSLNFLKNNKSSTFKKYVDQVVSETKQKLSSDIQIQNTKADGWDAAKLTVNKNGQPLRFIYVQNGIHPVSIVGKIESAAFKTIEQSVTDYEKTDLKNDGPQIRQVLQNFAQQLRDKKAHDLYSGAMAGFRSNVSEDQLNKLLAAEEVYTQGTVNIKGGSYSGSEFSAVINMVPLNKDFKPASGLIALQKENGQWKLSGLQLPNPLANKAQ